MKIVITGAKERDTEEDRLFVGSLMEKLIQEAPNSVFVTVLSHYGVGRFVKEKALERDSQKRYRFPYIECSVRVYAHDLSKSDMSQIYLGRNASPFEIADFLIYMASEDRRGTMEDMLERFKISNRPFIIFEPGDKLPERILDYRMAGS